MSSYSCCCLFSSFWRIKPLSTSESHIHTQRGKVSKRTRDKEKPHFSEKKTERLLELDQTKREEDEWRISWKVAPQISFLFFHFPSQYTSCWACWLGESENKVCEVPKCTHLLHLLLYYVQLFRRDGKSD